MQWFCWQTDRIQTDANSKKKKWMGFTELSPCQNIDVRLRSSINRDSIGKAEMSNIGWTINECTINGTPCDWATASQCANHSCIMIMAGQRERKKGEEEKNRTEQSKEDQKRGRKKRPKQTEENRIKEKRGRKESQSLRKGKRVALNTNMKASRILRIWQEFLSETRKLYISLNVRGFISIVP